MRRAGGSLLAAILLAVAVTAISFSPIAGDPTAPTLTAPTPSLVPAVSDAPFVMPSPYTTYLVAPPAPVVAIPTWKQRLAITCPLAPASTDVQRYALKLLGPSEYRCFYRVVQYESRWRVTVLNPWSQACGLGQAQPCSKMSGRIPDWRTNPEAQVRWVIAYMRDRYASAYGAAGHEFGYVDEVGIWRNICHPDRGSGGCNWY